MGKCVEVIGTLIYRDIFVRFKTMGRKEELSKCPWYPKRKLGVTTHF